MAKEKEMDMGPILLDVEGLTLTHEEQEMLAHPNVGGVIFFSRNYQSPQQLAALAKHIKEIRPNCLLCVDQEGGRVQRFVNGLTKLPKLSILGDLLRNQSYPLSEIKHISEKLGALMAFEVRSLGVDLSFAPVLDLDKGLSEVMRDRAIHADPDVVATLATAYIQGMAKAGMQATGKHFPGHGSVTLDSHLGLPEDLRPLDQMQDDLAPFRYLISQGIAALMPAHIIYPQIDPYPVGFSHYWLQTVLREQLQFKGTLISDDLSMGGATGMGDYQTRAKTALQAGCDFVLICNNRKGAVEGLDGVSQHSDSETQSRRANLLARGVTPLWEQLALTPIWQSMVAVMEQISSVSTCSS